MLGSVDAPTLLVCFRCEWTGERSADACPRCGVPLYRVAPPATRVVEPPGAPAPSGVPTIEFVGERAGAGVRRRSGRWVVVGLAMALAAGAATVVGGPGAVPRAGERTASVTEVSVPGRSLVVPEGLASRPDVLTLAVSEETGQGLPIRRLWRVDLPNGALVPGPIVSEVRDLRLLPRRELHGLAYLVDGGGLFWLRGFHAARPEWLARGISAFDLDARGRLLVVSVHQRTAPWASGIEVTVTVGRATPDDIHRPPLFTRRIRGLDVDGIDVRNGMVYLWGATSHGGMLVVLDAEGGGEMQRRRLGPARVLDVAPDGRLLLVDDGLPPSSQPLLASSSGAPPVVLGQGVVVEEVVAWSPDGGVAAVTGTRAGQGRALWLLPLSGGPAQRVGAVPEGEPPPAAFSADSRVLYWVLGRDVTAFDLETRTSARLELPSILSDPQPPLVVTAGSP